MTDVTITNQSGVTFTFADGEVQNVRGGVNADLDVSALPGSGPMGAFGFDFNGSTKIINLAGAFFETTSSRTSIGSTTTILEQKQWIEEILNGFQLVPMTFTSNYESQSHDGSNFVNTTILFGKMEVNETAGDPERLPFTITLAVAA